MNRKIIFIVVFLFGIIFSYNSYAQAPTNGKMRSILTYKFAQNIKWQNENKLTKFRIGILGNDPKFYAEIKKLKGKSLKNRSIEIIKFKNINDIVKTEILYIANDNVSDISRIAKKVANTNTLLVTDNCQNQKNVMTNFIYSDKGVINFEINKANMINDNLTVLPKLITLGGTEIDVAKLYKETQKSLDNEKVKVREQSNKIKKQQTKIAKQTESIKEQIAEIQKQKDEIIIQKEQIATQQEKLNILLEDITEKENALQAKIDTLAVQELRITEQEEKMSMQEKELVVQNTKISERSEKLKNLTANVDAQQDKLNSQRMTLAKQTATIAIQKYMLYIFITFLLLVGGLAYFIYRSYKIKQEINKKLEEKNNAISRQNAEISQQKEEIQAQTDRLEVQAEAMKKTNVRLEIEKEIRESSIRYALTIQEAILPIRSEINKMVKSFILFKPKDVVSGDFYWYHTIDATANHAKRTFIAAIDCTGHGVPGAFMSMIGTSILNKIVKEMKIYEPSQILEILHKEIQMALKQDVSANDDGMDVCFCSLEAKNNNRTKVVFTGAKRPLIILHRNTKNIEIVKGCIKSIGGNTYDDMKFTNSEMVLDKDAVLYLSTDGFADQSNPKRKRFTMTRFNNIIKENAHLQIHKQKEILENALDTHQAGTSQRDDITLIGIQLPLNNN